MLTCGGCALTWLMKRLIEFIRVRNTSWCSPTPLCVWITYTAFGRLSRRAQSNHRVSGLLSKLGSPKPPGKYLIALMRIVAFWCVFLPCVKRITLCIYNLKSAFPLPYNTQTRRLTAEMFRDVFDKIAVHLSPR